MYGIYISILLQFYSIIYSIFLGGVYVILYVLVNMKYWFHLSLQWHFLQTVINVANIVHSFLLKQYVWGNDDTYIKWIDRNLTKKNHVCPVKWQWLLARMLHCSLHGRHFYIVDSCCSTSGGQLSDLNLKAYKFKLTSLIMEGFDW